MNSIITNGIEIAVNTKYYPAQSDPKSGHYFFIYEIQISNKSEFTVQLLKRHWDIVDALGRKRMVDGEGVVGETPVIEPGDTYTYNSGCDFETEIGKMSGYYIMKREFDGILFNVLIPEFCMILPAKLN